MAKSHFFKSDSSATVGGIVGLIVLGCFLVLPFFIYLGPTGLSLTLSLGIGIAICAGWASSFVAYGIGNRNYEGQDSTSTTTAKPTSALIFGVVMLVAIGFAAVKLLFH